jgi:Extracellular link domain
MEQASLLKSTNQLLPMGMGNAAANVGARTNTGAASILKSVPWAGVAIFTVLVVVFITLMSLFSEQIAAGYNTVVNSMRGNLGLSQTPPEHSEPNTVNSGIPEPGDSADQGSIVEKILPPGNREVYSVSKNTFTYYDAEPLCKALGAELATYDQVKSSWERGADWCNYGWVKGQMAVYPTQKETWDKLQKGPEDQRLACGNPGLNGGYFDNPEMKFGVTCYGSKPSQSAHDSTVAGKGAPRSPGELEFDKKVAHFQSEADTMGILPFNGSKWST